jgi:hypothetical protein
LGKEGALIQSLPIWDAQGELRLGKEGALIQSLPIWDAQGEPVLPIASKVLKRLRAMSHMGQKAT